MKNDTLIAYYSWSGNTRAIAQLIARKTGGTLFEIEFYLFFFPDL